MNQNTSKVTIRGTLGSFGLPVTAGMANVVVSFTNHTGVADSLRDAANILDQYPDLVRIDGLTVKVWDHRVSVSPIRETVKVWDDEEREG